MDSSECGQLGVLFIKLPTVDRATTDRSEFVWMNFHLPNTVSGWHESEGAGPRGADQEPNGTCCSSAAECGRPGFRTSDLTAGKKAKYAKKKSQS